MTNARGTLRPTRSESKHEVTTTVARALIDSEVSARNKKTARLRALRMAQEAQAAPPEAIKK